MFHIKPDARAQASADLLYRALLQELTDKNLGDISITRLSQLSSVSRTTFYRNFDSVIDILHWKLDQEFKHALSSYSVSAQHGDESASLLLHVLDFWFAQPATLETVIRVGHLDLIYTCFYHNTHLVKDYARDRGLDLTGPGSSYSISLRAGFFIGIILAWLQQGKRHSARQVAHYIQQEHRKLAAADTLI